MLNARRHGRITIDPIYGYISLPDKLSAILDHEMVQRLRRISQTSNANYVYPSLNSPRFPHSLGTMSLAMEAWRAAWSNSEEHRERFQTAVLKNVKNADRLQPTDDKPSEEKFVTNVELAVGAAALLHDIGHPPFSHALEPVLIQHPHLLGSGSDLIEQARASGTKLHEFLGEVIAKDVLFNFQPPALKQMILHIVDKTCTYGWAVALRNLIDSEIDVDRIDFLLRDNYMAGTEYGSFDHERLVSSVEIRGPKMTDDFYIGWGSRARSGAEQMMLQRSQTYRWITFHPRVVASDHALGRCIDLLARLAASKYKIPSSSSDLGRELDIGQLFTDLIPDLDYVTGTPARLMESVGLASDDMALDLTGIRTEMRASVDDALVAHWIRSGMFLARALLANASMDDRMKAELQQLCRFGRAAMFRDKCLQPVWKNFEEYQTVADAIVADDSLASIVEDLWAQMLDDCDPDDQHSIETLRDRDTSILNTRDKFRNNIGSIEIFNHFAGLLVERYDRILGPYLTEHANVPIAGISGYWEATYRRFDPLSARFKSAYLFRARDEEVSLESTSPLVQTLPWIDKQRIKLFVFFCRNENIASGVQLPTAPEMRGFLQGAFVHGFREFVKDHYGRRQRELVDGIQLKGGNI